MTESPGSFTTEQLRGMADAVPADLQSQGQLPIDIGVGLNEGFNHALDTDETSLWPGSRRPEEIESAVPSWPVEFPRQNGSPMSMDHVLKSVDAWIAKQGVQAFDNALGINLGTERNKRRHDEVEWDVSPHQDKFQRQNGSPISMDYGLKSVNAKLAEQEVLALDNALGINLGTEQNKREYEDKAFDHALDMDETSLWSGSQRPEEIQSAVAPWPVEFPQENVSPMSMDHRLKSVDVWKAEQEVRAFDNALGINLETKRNKRKYEDEVEWDVAPRQSKLQRYEQRNEGLGLENVFLADWQGQTPSATGVWNGGAHNIAQSHEITPACRMSQYEEPACRAAVAEPGSQTPGVAVNGMALRLPHLELPSDNQGATASGSHLQKILNKVSAGTNLMAACRAACMLRNIKC